MAIQFDNNGELDFWYFGNKCERRPTVNMSKLGGGIYHEGEIVKLMQEASYLPIF